MANTTTTPNMGLPVPVPGTDPGPDWANNIVADMTAIDSHNHSSGQGVPVTPDGLDINADLPIGQNNLTFVRTVRFFAQGSPIARASDLGCLYESGVDLWFNDGAGNQVRLTQSGSPAGGAGSIGGLPSGTASASFSGSTFTFQSATNTPATMAVGPLVVGSASVSPKTVTIAPSVSQAVNYALTLPLSLPASTNYVTLDSSGNLASGGILTSGTYTPTVNNLAGTFVSAVAGSFSYSRIGDRVTVFGQIAGTTDSSSDLIVTVSLPVSPTSNFSIDQQVVGSGASYAPSSAVVRANLSSKLAKIETNTGFSVQATTVSVSFAYSCA